jgi:hypothetical protein
MRRIEFVSCWGKVLSISLKLFYPSMFRSTHYFKQRDLEVEKKKYKCGMFRSQLRETDFFFSSCNSSGKEKLPCLPIDSS